MLHLIISRPSCALRNSLLVVSHNANVPVITHT